MSDYVGFVQFLSGIGWVALCETYCECKYSEILENIPPPPFTPDLEKTKYLPILFEGKHISEREKKMMENVKKGREILKIEGK
jgi:hypothetical protein